MSKVHKCQICDKEISQDDVNFVLQASEMKLQNLTCEEHRPYGKAVQIWKVREMLGLPYVKPMAKCEICDSPITDDELECVDMGQMIITCENHIQHMYSCNLFEVKKDLGYSK